MLRVDGNGIPNQPNIKISNTSNRLVGGSNSKMGFEGSLKAKSSEDINKMLKDIKEKGAKLSKTQNYMDALSYKKAIQSYLGEVLEHMYTLHKTESLWGNRYYSVVDNVDKELYTLTNNLVSGESESIDVLKSIDKIEGMLIAIMA